MPSPFPGMDPYLEGRGRMSFHAAFCVEIARIISPMLRPRYVARATRRSIMDTSDNLAITTSGNIVYPDVAVIERSPVPLPTTSGSSTILEPTHQAVTQMPEMVPQYSVEIRDVEERSLVTLIELLSPANKRGRGYDEYVEKRTQILLSRSHLLELDLLRNGKRVPMEEELPNAPYFAFLSRWQQRPLIDMWAINLERPLPKIPIPLLPGDDEVALDLQAALTEVYDSLNYDLELDYANPPDVPLKDEAAKWADSLLSKFRA